ncbi:hypothetical protein MNEG_5716 [Monoraphidium neglectum]|uniref:Uncharacterized protein n=1 Tax=Monoraphidium neglectum TaxID=145388 RepID=A0A0D2L5D1_9CHLO|nr:hypothetical protein MNEG_5716 [Monoraphidium neglectum]KIZ02244.1 hypothetical protein MNEG_5716 [Monoraphidium neglectum]|eukprot:XP_013901263.1 hypothetical protein MNEG_5716 [Monoraphidium neglectum]
MDENGASDLQVEGEPEQHQQQQHTSLSFLQLHDAFKRMVAVGVDVVDEQTFYRIMDGVPDHLLWLFWQLYTRIVSGIVDNSMAEFDDLARETDMRQQLADLEALALQKGRQLGAGAGAPDGGAEGGSGGAEDAAAGPAAAEAAARVAAKRAEGRQLAEALSKLQRQRDDLRAQVDARRKVVDAAKAGYTRAADHMTELHSAMQGWRVDGALKAGGGTP